MITRIGEYKKPFLVITPISLGCHIIAFIQFQLRISSFYNVEHWYPQFLFLLLFSFALTAVTPLIKNIYAGIIILGLRFCIFIIVESLFEGYMGIRLTLITAILLDTALYIDFPINNAALLFIVALAAAVQRPIVAWEGKELLAPSTHDRIGFCFYSLVIAIVGSLLRIIYNRAIRIKEEAKRLNQAVLQLSSANVGYQDYAKNVKEKAVFDERQRVSREIHDTVGYALTNLTMMMEAAIDLSNSDSKKLRDILRKAKYQADEALQETHWAVRTLRSIDQTQIGGINSIHHIITNFEKATGVKVEVEYCNLPQSLGDTYDSIVYRTIQEGLTNAFRHGKATSVKIIFWRENGTINFWIRDNGDGSPDIIEGVGLAGMRERISAIGGDVHVKNVNQGFELAIRFPWNGGREDVTHNISLS